MSSTTVPDASVARATAGKGIDPRGPQVGAWLTSAALVAVLLLGTTTLGGALLAGQTVVFAVGALAGVQRSPYAWLFRKLVRPRLAPPKELEDPAPPRFAQAVGLVFGALGLIGFAIGAAPLALGATGLALVAALLNAVFRFCLGCEFYLLVQRATAR